MIYSRNITESSPLPGKGTPQAFLALSPCLLLCTQFLQGHHFIPSPWVSYTAQRTYVKVAGGDCLFYSNISTQKFIREKYKNKQNQTGEFQNSGNFGAHGAIAKRPRDPGTSTQSPPGTEELMARGFEMPHCVHVCVCVCVLRTLSTLFFEAVRLAD